MEAINAVFCEILCILAVADLGGRRGGGGAASGRLFLGIRPSVDPKVSFVLFWDIHFFGWLTLNFLKAPWAQIYSNFEGRARAEKNATFWSKFFRPSFHA